MVMHWYCPGDALGMHHAGSLALASCKCMTFPWKSSRSRWKETALKGGRGAGGGGLASGAGGPCITWAAHIPGTSIGCLIAARHCFAILHVCFGSVTVAILGFLARTSWAGLRKAHARCWYSHNSKTDLVEHPHLGTTLCVNKVRSSASSIASTEQMTRAEGLGGNKLLLLLQLIQCEECFSKKHKQQTG